MPSEEPEAVTPLGGSEVSVRIPAWDWFPRWGGGWTPVPWSALDSPGSGNDSIGNRTDGGVVPRNGRCIDGKCRRHQWSHDEHVKTTSPSLAGRLPTAQTGQYVVAGVSFFPAAKIRTISILAKNFCQYQKKLYLCTRF